MNNWKETTVRDIAIVDELVINGDYPYDQIEYIDIASVEKGAVNTVQHLSLTEAPSRAKRVIHDNDILISTVRPNLKHYCYIKKASANLIASTGFAVITAKKADPAYLYYLLTTDGYTDYLTQIAEGHTSTYPSFNPEVIENSIFVIPPLPEQKAIAAILSSFDDKIELLRRQNKTLEKIAQAIFKEWFVNFTVNGKKLKIDNSTGLPEGWRMGTLNDIADIIDCLHSKKPECCERGLPLLQVWNICDSGLLDMTDTYYIKEQDYNQWISRMEASPGDCVITNVGRVGAVAQIPKGFKAALGRNMTGIRCKPSFPYPTFLIECLLSNEMRNEIITKSDAGTILDALNVRNIPALRFNLANKDVIKAFEAIAGPLRAKIGMNNSQIQTLSKLRDALLPKLMKGEIRVKDADNLVKEKIK